MKPNIQKIIHYKTSYQLAEDVRLADAIKDLDAGRSPYSNNPLFQQVVSDIVSKVQEDNHNSNDYDINFIASKFGISNPGEQNLLRTLIYYKVGRNFSDKEVSLDLLDTYYDEMPYGFDYGFEPSEESLENLVEDALKEKNNIIRSTRAFHTTGSELVKYCHSQLSSNKTDDELIEEVDPYNDGSYTELRGYIQYLSHLLYQKGMFDKWIKILELLEYFPLQGALFFGIKTVEECANIIQTIDKSNLQHKRVLQYLLRERMYSIMCQEPKALTENSYNPDRRLSVVIQKQATKSFEEYNTLIERISSDVISHWVKWFGLNDMVSWYVTTEVPIRGKDERFVGFNRKALAVIKNNIDIHLDFSAIEYDQMSFNQISYFLESSLSCNVTEEQYRNLIGALCKAAYQNKAFYSLSLNNENFNLLRAAYNVLNRSGLNGLSMVRDYHQFEKCDEQKCWEHAFRIAEGDSFWYAMLLLQIEETKDQSSFKCIADKIFDYDNIGGESYLLYERCFLPLYIAELISLQVLQQEKDWYENVLIDRLDKNIILLLRVLSANGGEMSSSNKSKLTEIVSSKWDEAKIRLRKADRRMCDFLQKYIDNAK